jgi:serine/threonine-protein kinase
MATVWRGQDLRLQRPVAVKVLDPAVLADPEVRGRLGHEARTLARLVHPNIVAVHDVDVAADSAYLVMELVDGPSLATRQNQGRLAVTQAVRIAIGVCDALTAAHGAGVLHRDIKPGNILLAPDGGVKVCDFGIARPSTTATDPNAAIVLGTSEYLAPERASGGTSDTRSDLYALGCVLYGMLAGAPPFTGRNPVGVLYQHLHQPPRPLATLRPEVPAGLDRLVLDLLAKDPADRPATAAAVRGRLATLGRDTDTPGDPERTTVLQAVTDPSRTLLAPRSGGPGHRRRPQWTTLGWAAALVFLLLLGGTLALLSTVDGQPGAAGRAGDSSPTLGLPPTPPSGAASRTSKAPAPTFSATRPATAADQIAALQATVSQQAGAGQLDLGSATDLNNTLDDIARRLTKGQTGQAVSRVGQFRDRLAQLAQDGKLTGNGYQILAAGIDQLAGALPQTATSK